MIDAGLFHVVERSLRKRLHSDVRPLLLRCAARAHDEHEFLHAAARLVMDPQERPRWVASWRAWREGHPSDSLLHDLPGTGHTRPTELAGAPSSAPPASTPQPAAQSPASAWSPAQLELLRLSLAQELGPIASVLIEKHASRAKSAPELRERLMLELDTDEQRERFARATGSVVPPASASPA